MNKKIILILFISLSIIMCTAVSAENLTTTDSGVVNGGLYSNAIQKTPYYDQPNGDNQEEVSFNITKKEAKTTGSSNTQTGSSSQTTQHIKNVTSAKLHTMIYVQNTNNRISSYVNVSLDGDNDGTYEVELENNRLLNITSSKDGEVYRVNENITRVYSDYLLSYDIADYIKSDTVNVKVHAVSAAGDSDSKIKYVGLVAAYNVEDSQSDKEVHYWINSGHSWTDENSKTTFDTNYDIEGIDGANVTLTQVSTASSAAETYLNGHEINPVEPVPGTYFAQNIYDIAEYYDAESNELEFSAGNGLYGSSYKTTLATLEVEVPTTSGGSEEESANVTVSDVRVTSNNNRVLLALLNNTIRVSMANTGSVIDQANVTLNIGDYSQTKQINSLGSTTQNVVFDYFPLTNATTEMSVDIDYLNGTTERIYTNTTIIYYNGYMGKSFTGGENFTVKRGYEGFNNLVIIQTNEYKSASWQDFNVTVDSSEYGVVDADKVVDVLYYQGYNWDYGYVLDTLELKLNNKTLNHIAFYNDTKGFATWNFPSGLLVYNVTDTFKVNDTNTIEFIRHDSPQLALYTGYFVVIYENSTKYRNIQITEECDLLNTEDSGYGANNTTAVSYASYGGFNKQLYNSTQLYVITGAANWDDGSLVYFNDQTLASMAENWNASSQESFSLFDINDVSEDENLVTMQSINDNFVVYSTILIVNYDYPRFSVSKVDVPASKGDLLVETPNNVTVNLLNEGAQTTANITITVDDTTEKVVLEKFEGETTLNISYNPSTTGEKNVKVEVTYENGTTETLYEGTLNAYYNGYRGKSFTGQENFTTKREYTGQNTLILEQYNYYNWNATSTATYDATDLEADKIVDALYYQGYNWDKNLNFKLTVNGEDAPIIANYSDTKGFATYNYPSGLVVFNITEQFKAGQTNTITPVQLENNSNILYGGILVIIYANNTNVTNILINEETDLLNPEASGLTTNDNTKAYSLYENVDTTALTTTLYTITAAADKIGESKIIFNNAEYGSMADNYNSVSKLSIVTSKINNIAETTNIVTLHSLSDNLVVFGTILLQTYEQQPNITVTKVDVPASKGDLLVDTENNITVAISNNGGLATGTLTVTVDDVTQTFELEDFEGETTFDVKYTANTTGEKNVKVEVTYENGITETLYEETIYAYYNGYRGKSFTGQENFTTQRSYAGQNTLIFEQYDYYNWNATSTATFDATELKSHLIIDALYYQGYNWDKYLNFGLTVNGEDAPIIANYSDTKGFGTYNYPSGLVVFNITGLLQAGQVNTITPVQLESNSNILYGGILVIIYANNTNYTNIFINEGFDLLNPEASGLTSNDYTKAYSIYDDVKVMPSTTLYTITAAADKVGESKIMFNDVEYGCMADNYNSVSKLSVVTSEINNVVEGTNTVTLHSTGDNLFVMSTILVTSLEREVQETSVVIEPITTQIGETINLTVSVTVGDDVVDEGKVYFKVNGRVLRDESGRVLFAQVNDGIAVLENFTVPDNWNNDTRIVAGFVGNKYVLSSNSEEINPVIIASEDEPSIVVENVNSGVDEDVTIRVNVNNIDDGKIIMKINGKTVKDLSTGKLYVKVVDGVAEVTYHVPKTMKAGEYDIKVVYTKGNTKLEETGTLTVEN